MDLEAAISVISSLWAIEPVQWFVYSALVLFLGFVYVMRLKRIRDNEGLSLVQKVVGYPVSLFVVVWDWLFNWTFATIIYREFPYSWNELLTHRLQRALNNPEEYSGYRLWIARILKPILNEHDKGHLK